MFLIWWRNWGWVVALNVRLMMDGYAKTGAWHTQLSPSTVTKTASEDNWDDGEVVEGKFPVRWSLFCMVCSLQSLFSCSELDFFFLLSFFPFFPRCAFSLCRRFWMLLLVVSEACLFRWSLLHFLCRVLFYFSLFLLTRLFPDPFSGLLD